MNHEHNTPDAPPREERIAMLTGDRLCAACGFNLTGQVIVREPAYGLLIARCPECFTAAALQEYPLLGRWAGRFGAVLAGVWLLALLGAWALSATVMYAFANETAMSAADRFAERIAEAHLAWLQETVAADPTSQQSLGWMLTQGSTPWANIDVGWWELQDGRAMLAEAGGWIRAANWSALWMWAWMALAALAVGVFWSVALPHLRGWRQALIACAVVALGAFFAVLGRLDTGSLRVWASARMCADELMGAWFEALSLGFGLVALTAALRVGRPLARAAVRGLLPPRMRGTLAFLWLADGLGAPRTRGGQG